LRAPRRAVARPCRRVAFAASSGVHCGPSVASPLTSRANIPFAAQYGAHCGHPNVHVRKIAGLKHSPRYVALISGRRRWVHEHQQRRQHSPHKAALIAARYLQAFGLSGRSAFATSSGAHFGPQNENWWRAEWQSLIRRCVRRSLRAQQLAHPELRHRRRFAA
jgi:hypothetical protein